MSRIVVMGSGETAPTMVKVHREVFAACPPGPAVMLDTPFAFQMNRDELVTKTRAYFAQSVGRDVDVAVWSGTEGPAQEEKSLALLDRAAWAFAGPGSPTYALRRWRGTRVPAALTGVVRRGGTVVLGSAAAVTLGSHAVPVYEIYKVGADPAWADGLDLLGELTGRHCRRRAALRQQGRRDPRHEVLLPRRAAARAARGDAAGRGRRPRRGRAHRDGHRRREPDHDGERQRAGQRPATRGDHARSRRGSRSGSTSSRRCCAASGPRRRPVRPPSYPRRRRSRSTPANRSRCRCGRRPTGPAPRSRRRLLRAMPTAASPPSSASSRRSPTGRATRCRATTPTRPAGCCAPWSCGSASSPSAVRPTPRSASHRSSRRSSTCARAARDNKDFGTSDLVRDRLVAAGVEVRDTPDGTEWSLSS